MIPIAAPFAGFEKNLETSCIFSVVVVYYGY
jgi:hypothetical protein